MVNHDIALTRIHLKTDTKDRSALIQFCLHSKEQVLAIGWSCVYKDNPECSNFNQFYELATTYCKNHGKRKNAALNRFYAATIDDLFWTRDMDGYYWICRVKGLAESKCIENLDIGSILPIEAYQVGLEVPGQIKSVFNRPNGGIAQRIKDTNIIEYSKKVYNNCAKKEYYKVALIKENTLLDNLPPEELEELVISYLQIHYDYYLLSNSIANKSTTIKIECELMSRNPKDPQKAVVQVKGPKAKTLDAREFKNYEKDGYKVFLYAPEIKHKEELNNLICISREDLLIFYKAYKEVLPQSIRQWETLLN